MQALVLEKTKVLALRDFAVDEVLRANDVRVAIQTSGIALGHDSVGVVTELGAAVPHLAVGGREGLEPGVPDPNSRATRLGLYILDPRVCFWATPPMLGCMRSSRSNSTGINNLFLL